MKKVVSITEADLKRIVKKVLKEQAQSQPSVYTSSTFKPRNYGSLFDLLTKSYLIINNYKKL